VDQPKTFSENAAGISPFGCGSCRGVSCSASPGMVFGGAGKGGGGVGRAARNRGLNVHVAMCIRYSGECQSPPQASTSCSLRIGRSMMRLREAVRVRRDESAPPTAPAALDAKTSRSSPMDGPHRTAVYFAYARQRRRCQAKLTRLSPLPPHAAPFGREPLGAERQRRAGCESGESIGPHRPKEIGRNHRRWNVQSQKHALIDGVFRASVSSTASKKPDRDPRNRPAGSPSVSRAAEASEAPKGQSPGI
jgi:hypothetical protein